MAFLGIDSVLEGLFTMVVVAIFLFFVTARVKHKSMMDFYNEVMDKLFGESKALNMDNPLKGKLKMRQKPLK